MTKTVIQKIPSYKISLIPLPVLIPIDGKYPIESLRRMNEEGISKIELCNTKLIALRAYSDLGKEDAK